MAITYHDNGKKPFWSWAVETCWNSEHFRWCFKYVQIFQQFYTLLTYCNRLVSGLHMSPIVPSSHRLSVLPRYCEVTQDAQLDQALGLAPGHAERSERSERSEGWDKSHECGIKCINVAKIIWHLTPGFSNPVEDKLTEQLLALAIFHIRSLLAHCFNVKLPPFVMVLMFESLIFTFEKISFLRI